MSLARLSAGAGYQYLLRHTACGDASREAGTELTAYYAESGYPPGTWFGTGLAGLGLSTGDVTVGSTVTEGAMARVFGSGHDPVTDRPLGRAYPTYRTRAQRVADAVALLPEGLRGAERETAVAAIERVESARRPRVAVAGFDMTFTAPKSASVLWALADPVTQQAVLDAHHAAVRDVLSFVESRAVFTRVGARSCAQVPTRGMVAALFDHWDTRTGDPNLHTHVVIANRVQGLDGKWRTLDSRALHHAVVAISEVYDNLFADHLARVLPVAWEHRDRGPRRTPAFELAGLPDRLLAEFSTRSAQVDAAMVAAVADFKATRGRGPSRVETTQLRQRITRQVRPAKTARRLTDLMSWWRQRASALLHLSPEQITAGALRHRLSLSRQGLASAMGPVRGRSAGALERLLKRHEVFKAYTIVLAAGDGRSGGDDGLDEAGDDVAISGRSLEKVREAIKNAEAAGGKTITLSVGQLTTGVTVPEWTAVVMLSNISSPALYMQAAFRAQNPHTFIRNDNAVFQKQNSYIFDFAPERTLTIFDAFANNLAPNPPVDSGQRQENIRRLLNFFPVLGEDSEGRMMELDATQVLTFPQVFKAREVVRRGFLSNLLFANVAGIFRYSEHVKEILDKLPTAKQGKVTTGQPLDLPHPPPTTDIDGNVKVDVETIINPKVAAFGKPVWTTESVPPVDASTPARVAAAKIAEAITEQARATRGELQESYGLTAKQVERDTKALEAKVKTDVERAYTEHQIAQQHLEDEAQEAATEADVQAVAVKRAVADQAFQANILSIVEKTMDRIVPEVVTREETKKVQKQADKSMDDARSHLRGFARTIPMFLMAYGDRGIRLANFDDYTPDDVFEEITGISEAEFRLLRDGQDVMEDDGSVTLIPGLFDEAVFDQSIQEFLDKKQELADYFNPALTEDIFAYVPQQKTSLVFTPKAVVTKMVDILEAENPSIFSDPTRTFADLFSTAGLFLMELVRRLDTGLAGVIPDQEERLRHILTSQIYEMSHNEILHRITVEAVSGGVEERKVWIEASGHFRVGNLAHMTPEDRTRTVAEMLGES
ncbi:MAG: MobF family relaxase [Actinomycetes bacterium]